MDETAADAAEKHSDNSKKESFAFDVLTLAGGTTFAQIITILSVPVLTRLYGPQDFGVWTLYISITSIISVIACLRYEYSIMLPESDEEAVNLLGLSFLAVVFVSGLTLPILWYFKEPIAGILNSQQIGDYLWLVPPFIFVSWFVCKCPISVNGRSGMLIVRAFTPSPSAMSMRKSSIAG